MKKLIFVFTLILSMLACGAALGSDKMTEEGKLKRKGNDIEFHVEGGPPTRFTVATLKDTTEAFRKCIDDGKYKGVVEITGGRNSFPSHVEIMIDKETTCKRK